MSAGRQSGCRPSLIQNATKGFALAFALSALGGCKVLAKREVISDPKSEVSDEAKAQYATAAPMSLILTDVAVEASSVQVGGQVGVTVTLRDTNNEPMTTLTGLTVQTVLYGGGSAGTMSSVIDHHNGVFTTTLTAVASGSASKVLTAINGSLLYDQPEITITPGTATKVRIETCASGGSSKQSTFTVTEGASVVLCSNARDAANNYVRGVTVTWSDSNGLGRFVQQGVTVTYTPIKGSGRTTLTADHATLTDDTTTVNGVTVTWSADTLSGTTLLVWLKADALLTSLANNASVATWSDVSSHSNHALAVSTSQRPTYKTSQGPNSRPTVVFDGVNDEMTITNTADLSSFGALSIFVVAKHTANGWTSLVSKASDGTWTDGWGFGEYSGSGTTFGLFINNVSNKAAGTWSGGAYKYLTAVYDLSNIRFYVNGSLGGTYVYSSSINNSMADIHLGNYLGNSGCSTGCLTGEMAEVLIYNTGVTTPQRSTIETYLANKYGL